MKKKFTFILALTAVLCACVSFAACGISGGNGKRKETAPVDITLGEITDCSIEVLDCVFDDEYAHFPQLSLDGENWTEGLNIGEGFGSYIFEGLEPNTEYTVYARGGSRDDSRDPSDAVTKKATTLRTAAAGIPEGVDYVQEYGKITLVNFTDEMEASFDNGVTYGGGEHTYKTKSGYTVLVRYKQTDRAFASEPCSIAVQYSDFLGGLGTEQKPYLVSKYEELLKVNRSRTTFYKLVNDIAFPEEAVGSIPLKGKLDGNGKKLISPKIDTALNGNGESSLFYLGNNSTDSRICNLTVENILYTSNKREYLGKEGLLCDTAKEVTNCQVTGEMIINEVSGKDTARFGGIAGYADFLGKITGCTADVKFTVSNGAAAEKSYYFGGIAGDSYSSGVKITGCKASVSFSMTAENNYDVTAGGIIGRANYGVDISACSAQISFSALGGNKVELGGIAGRVNSSVSIINCFASGDVTASGNPDYVDGYGKFAKLVVGGVIGGIEGIDSAGAQNCVSSVNLEVDGTGVDVHCAGIIAEISAREQTLVANCLYAGTVTVNADEEKQTCTGAILGSAEPLYTVENCYYTPQAPVTDWTVDGGTEVDGDTCLSAGWQREHLQPDETLWEIADGKLPGLK